MADGKATGQSARSTATATIEYRSARIRGSDAPLSIVNLTPLCEPKASIRWHELGKRLQVATSWSVTSALARCYRFSTVATNRRGIPVCREAVTSTPPDGCESTVIQSQVCSDLSGLVALSGRGCRVSHRAETSLLALPAALAAPLSLGEVHHHCLRAIRRPRSPDRDQATIGAAKQACGVYRHLHRGRRGARSR